MKHRATQTLFAYWDELRAGRAAPERCKIDPTEIRDILADTFMLDVDVGRRFPFRLAGTRVSALFDAEQKGQSFLELWRADERRNLCAITATVSDSVLPVVAGATGTFGQLETCAVELLLLPLRHEGRTQSRILGLMTPLEPPAAHGLIPLGPLSLRALRIIHPNQENMLRPYAALPPARHTGSPRSAPSRPVTRPAETKGPRLRVIEGGLSR